MIQTHSSNTIETLNDPAELAINRQGRLSLTQQNKLRRQSQRFAGCFSLIIVPFLAFIGYGISRLAGQSLVYVPIAIWIFLLVLYVYLMWFGIRLLVDAARGLVKQVSGQPEIKTVTRRAGGTTNTSLFLHFEDGTRLPIPPGYETVFQTGEDYHVYYTPLAKMIVGVEPFGPAATVSDTAPAL